jgi:ABC-type nickel/cobalt efflux system permease component RcnA
MRYFLTFAALAMLVGLSWFWMAGGFDRLGLWAAAQQRGFQNNIAGALRSIRAGEAGAIVALLGACFAYGLVHAAGPGHGKVLIGGYGFARKIPMLRLSLIALAASLAQAVTAVMLVYAGVFLLGLGRAALVDVTEAVMAPVSYGAIALIGLWLVWRGLRKLLTRGPAHGHAHQGHEAVCSSCGHAHGPTLDQVEQAGTLREALALIAGIAVRPCTGALFVLIITWQMGIAGIGIAGAFAMALGTALITIFVGLAAGGLRGGALASFSSSTGLARGVAVAEFLAGGVVVFVATGLLLRAV